MTDIYDQFKTIMEENTDGHEVDIRYGNSKTPTLPAIRFLKYFDLPKPGLLTVVTYGVSLADHESWRDERPEFMLTIKQPESTHVGVWGLLMDLSRSRVPFVEGFVLTVNHPLSKDTGMKGFCFAGAAPLPINPLELYDRRITIRTAFPVYEGEAKMISAMGWRAFMTEVGEDRIVDVRRPDLSKGATLDRSQMRPMK